MKARQINKAARLYGLAVLALADTGGAENDEESAVMWHTIESARAKLVGMGYHWPDLSSLGACIDAATQGDKGQS